MESPLPLDIPPGVVKADTGEGSPGRWSDTLGVRFKKGRPEKKKGFEQINTALLDGIARGMDAWNTRTGAPLYAVGTNTKLYGSIDGLDVIDITPLRYQTSFVDELSITNARGAITAEAEPLSTGNLSNPFATTNGSPIVTVTHPSHGHATGDLVYFSGASAVGGITVAGVYAITSTGAGTYTVTHTSNAGATTSGGGLVSYAWPIWPIGTRLLIRGNSFQGGSSIGGVFMEDEYEVVKVVDGDSYIIYPTRERVTLGANPISTTNLSPTVEVTHVAHGRSVGDSVWFHGPVTVGGLVIDGEFIISAIVDADRYRFTHGSNATSTTTGGTSIETSWAEPATFTETLGGGTVPYILYLEDPFTTTNASTTVTVHHVDHGAIAGDTIFVDGATAVGGITIDGTYDIDLVVDDDNYTITHSVAASSGATGGGSDVVIEYELSKGSPSAFTSDRDYGEGDYGADVYGDVIPLGDPTYFDPRSWAIDRAGEDAIMSPLGGTVYYWNGTTDRADAIPGVPSGLRYAFMTDERILIVLGVGGDSLLMGWSSQGAFGDFLADETDEAGYRRVYTGSTFVAGTRVENGVNILWTDTACFTHQFTGGRFIYRTTIATGGGAGAGLIGPQAFAVTPRGVLWMAANHFMLWSGSVQPIPNAQDIESWVYENISEDQQSKCVATYDVANNSVDFYFPEMGEAEPNVLVTVSLDDWSWVNDLETRTTAASFDKGKQSPIRVGTNGKVYRHEVGVDDDGVSAPSSITLAPYSLGDHLSEILGFDPDFKRLTGEMGVTFVTYDRNPRTPEDTETNTVTEDDELVDFHVEGRHLSLTLTQDELGGDWALGQPKILVQPLGKRR